jgi:hypothetical protein
MIPLQLPGTLITRLGQYLRSDRPGWHTPNTFDQIGTLLVLGASVLKAYAIASLLVALITRRQLVFGRFYWRIMLFYSACSGFLSEKISPKFGSTLLFIEVMLPDQAQPLIQ